MDLPLVGPGPFSWTQAALAYRVPSTGPSLLGSVLGTSVAGMRRLPLFRVFRVFRVNPGFLKT